MRRFWFVLPAFMATSSPSLSFAQDFGIPTNQEDFEQCGKD